MNIIPNQVIKKPFVQLPKGYIPPRKDAFTIYDLAAGKVALVNDGSLEELRLVLKAAFPYDISTIHGTGKYYHCQYKDKWIAVHSISWKNHQSVKDFLPELAKS